MDLLMTNGLGGLLLVFVVLAVFGVSIGFLGGHGNPDFKARGRRCSDLYGADDQYDFSVCLFAGIGDRRGRCHRRWRNIYRYQEKGLKPLELHIEGTSVFPAVLHQCRPR